MNNAVTKVAVVGSGISGAVCASHLARSGVSVTLFDSARGPGGRMSQRREITEDGKELLFDHGAPFFTVTNSEVLRLLHEWESRGLVAEWKEKFGSFDCGTQKFIDIEQEGLNKRFVGVPGMNSICKALSCENGVESIFGMGIGKFEWSDDQKLWSLMSLDGQNLGQFKGIVASDKNLVSPRITEVTGRLPPLDLTLVPELSAKLHDLPVRPCFAVMLAFAEPLTSPDICYKPTENGMCNNMLMNRIGIKALLNLIPVKGFSIKNSQILSWAHCESSKPGRSTLSERWVLHSTAEYAESIIAQTGLKKPSDATLKKVAEELLQEFQNTGLDVSLPFFKKAHRWGSAFPAASIAPEDKCLWDRDKRLAICGDFCVSPNVEGAVDSGLAAASRLRDILSCL